jgi:hypothetical protein
MFRWQMRQQQQRKTSISPDNGIIELLTTRQHLRPHQPLREVLQAAMDELGCCPVAIERAVTWLDVDASKAVGRLRRTELVQLANSICRFWRQAVSSDAPADSSAENSPR